MTSTPTPQNQADHEIEAAAEAMGQADAVRAMGKRRLIPWGEASPHEQQKWLGLARAAAAALSSSAAAGSAGWKLTGSGRGTTSGPGIQGKCEMEWFRASDGVRQWHPVGFEPNTGLYSGFVINNAAPTPTEASRSETGRREDAWLARLKRKSGEEIVEEAIADLGLKLQSVVSPLTPRPVGEAALREAAFLLDRLRDFENEGLDEAQSTAWMGHVRPSIARLTAALASPTQPAAGQGATWLVDFLREAFDEGADAASTFDRRPKEQRWSDYANTRFNAFWLEEQHRLTPAPQASHGKTAPGSDEGEGWRTMDSAPKDGSRVQILLANAVAIGKWLDNSRTQWWWKGWTTDLGPFVPHQVRGWQPLASVPTPADDAKEGKR